MSDLTYRSSGDKPLVWLGDQVKSPPFSADARKDVGVLLRLLQRGQRLLLPESRPMPSIASGCHELRITDRGVAWRIVYHVDSEAIVILDVFSKKSPRTPRSVIERCRRRLRRYRETGRGRGGSRG